MSKASHTPEWKPTTVINRHGFGTEFQNDFFVFIEKDVNAIGMPYGASAIRYFHEFYELLEYIYGIQFRFTVFRV